METQLVVVGGGPGGYAAAFRAADLGIQATLVEAQPRLGGTCLLRGCIPSKALLHVAKVMDEAARLARWGVAYEKPAVDLDALRARKDKVVGALAGGLSRLAKARKVRVLRARARFESSDTLRLEPSGGEPFEDDRLRFEHAIVATGSIPTSIPSLALPTPRVMDSTGALQLPDVPESLLVVGGGYIGLEMGSVYAALGSRVSVVEMTGGLLPGVDRDLVKPLARELKKRFEAVWLNAKVTAVAEQSDAIEVTFEGEAPEEPRRFDRVLVSVGRRPRSAELGLENTKVELDERGFLAVDACCRTADARILAIGDVAGEPMLAHKASHQGKVAAEALAGRPATFAPRAIPAVVFTDPEIAWAGLSETEAQAEGRAIETAQFPWSASGRAQAVGATGGLTKWVIDPASQRLLGCGIVGPGAGELIGEAVLAVETGATVPRVAEAIHPHPTLTETLGGAAEAFLGTAIDLYKPKRRASKKDSRSS